MRHIHIALVLLVCSVVTLTFANSTFVYRRYHRRRPSIRKEQENVVEVVEVFKTYRRPPALMRSDKSIENFLLCDAKCERKRFLRRRRICLRTGRLCPTRQSRRKSSQPTTENINVSTRPEYKKPVIYPQNPYGNQNPDYTHLYPWSRPSVTVTKYQPDRSKDFNMTIVEVNNDTVVTTMKYDDEYYIDNDEDHYHQRRSTTFRVPTTIQQWITPKTSTETTEATTTIPSTTFVPKPSLPTTTMSTVTVTEPPATTEIQTPTTVATTRPTISTFATTTRFIPPTTESTTTMEPTQSVTFLESTTTFVLPAPSTFITVVDTTTSSTTEMPKTSSIEITTEAPTSTTEKTVVASIIDLPLWFSLSTRAPTHRTVEGETSTATQSWTPTIQTDATTTENQTETTTIEEETEDYPDEYDPGEYDEEEDGGDDGGEGEGEEGAEDENDDYDYDQNYDEEETEDQA